MAFSPRTLSPSTCITAAVMAVAVPVVAFGFYNVVIDTDHYLEVYCPPQQQVFDYEGLLPAIERAAQSTGAQLPQNTVGAIADTNPDIGPNKTILVCLDGDKKNVASLNGIPVPKR